MPAIQPSNTASPRTTLIEMVQEKAVQVTTNLTLDNRWQDVAKVEIHSKGQSIGRCIDVLPIDGICLDPDGKLIVRSGDDYRFLVIAGQLDSTLRSILAILDELLDTNA